MTRSRETNIGLAVGVGFLFFGVLLALLGLASGNTPLVNPGLNQAATAVTQNRLSSEQLAEWILSGRKDFRLVGVSLQDSSPASQRSFPIFKFYDPEDLKNQDVLRRMFPDLGIPLVVYGDTDTASMELASWLSHSGYTVYLLEGGYRGFASRYLQPVATPLVSSPEKQSELYQKQLLYWYFSGNDPLLGSQSYGNSSSMRKGSLLRDIARPGESPASTPKTSQPVQPSKDPDESENAAEGC